MKKRKQLMKLMLVHHDKNPLKMKNQRLRMKWLMKFKQVHNKKQLPKIIPQRMF